MTVAWIGLRDLRNALVGRRGYVLTNVVYRVATVMLLTQIVVAFNSLLLAVGPETRDARIVLFLLVETANSAVLVYAFLRLDQFSDDQRQGEDQRSTMDEPIKAQQDEEGS
jgi:hypothetical protein